MWDTRVKLGRRGCGGQWRHGIISNCTDPPLQISHCSLPERFICLKQAITCLGELLFFFNGCLVVNSCTFSYCPSISLFPQLNSLFCLSLSKPYTVAISSFQPSSAAPTSWLTHFCSEVTGFLANFQRVVLTPDLLSAPHLPHCPRRGLGCANCERLAY